MKMPLEEQLKHIKQEYPEGYNYLASEFKLPRFDDDDELISEEKEDDLHENLFEPRTCPERQP